MSGGPWSGLGDSASEKGVVPHLIIWACEPLWGAGRGCVVSGREVDPVVSPWSAWGRGTPKSVSTSCMAGQVGPLSPGAPRRQRALGAQSSSWCRVRSSP